MRQFQVASTEAVYIQLKIMKTRPNSSRTVWFCGEKQIVNISRHRNGRGRFPGGKSLTRDQGRR